MRDDQRKESIGRLRVALRAGDNSQRLQEFPTGEQDERMVQLVFDVHSDRTELTLRTRGNYGVEFASAPPSVVASILAAMKLLRARQARQVLRGESRVGRYTIQWIPWVVGYMER